MQKKHNMLIVDDVKINRRLLKVSFEPEYNVLEAASGREALDILHSIPVDIVVTDIFMDDIDGYQLIQAIRSEPELQQMPVIAITEYDEVMQQKVMDLGASDLIHKPFVSTLLRSRVKNVLNSNSIDIRLTQYHSVFDRNPLAFQVVKLTCDVQGHCLSYTPIYQNEASCVLFGRDFSMRYLNRPQQLPKILNLLDEVSAAPQDQHRFCFFWEQEKKYLEITAYQEDQDYVACLIADVTQQKIKEKLEATQEYLDTKIAGCALTFFRDAGYPLEFISQPALDLLGYATQKEFCDATGGTLEAAVHPDDREAVHAAIDEQLQIKNRYSVTYRFQKKNGSYIWIQEEGKPEESPKDSKRVFAAFLDVSKQKQEAQSLLELIENISTGVLVATCQDNVISLVGANQAACDLMGVAKERVMGISGDNVYQLVHSEDLSIVKKTMNDVFGGKDKAEVSYRCKNHKTGKYFPALLTIRKVVQADGTLIAYICYTDLTLQKAAEEDLQRQAEYQKMLFDTLPSGVVRFQCSLAAKSVTCIYVNQRACAIYGVDRDATAAALVQSVNMDEVLSLLSHANVTAPTPVSFEKAITRGSGEQAWVKGTCNIITTPQEDPLLQVIFTDITAQKHLEQQLEEASRQAEALIANMPGGIIRQTSQNGTLISSFVSDGFAAMLGYSPRELMYFFQQVCNPLVHPEDRERMSAVKQGALQNLSAINEQYRVRHHDGHYLWINLRANIFQASQGERILYGTFTDISPLMALEERLRESEASLVAAVKHAGLYYVEYDILNKKAKMGIKILDDYPTLPAVLQNFPESWANSDFIHPDDRAQYLKNTHEIENGAPYMEWDARHLNLETGKYIWKRIRYTTLFDQNHTPVRAIATAQNIEALAELKSRFNQTVSQNGIWTWELSLTDHRIVDTLRNSPVMFGCTDTKKLMAPEAALAQKFIHPDFVNIYKDLHTRIYSGEKQVSSQLKVWSEAHNDYVWREFIFTSLDNEGAAPERALCTSRDISAEKNLERLFQEELSSKKDLAASLVAASRVNLTKGIVESITKGNENALTEDIVPVTDYRSRLKHFFADVLLSDKDNEELSAASLIQLYQSGQHTLSKEFMVIAQNTSQFFWLHMDCHLLARPDSNEIIAFFYYHDHSAQYISDCSVDSILRYEYDFAGIIIAQTGHIHLRSRNAKANFEIMDDTDYNRNITPISIPLPRSAIRKNL